MSTTTMNSITVCVYNVHNIGSSYYYATHISENYLNLTKVGQKLNYLFKIDYDYGRVYYTSIR